MLKIFFLCRRRPDITREQYAAFVLEGHAPLALKHHPTLLRYVINIAESSPPGGPELDSLPALYFANLEDFRERLYDSPEGREVVRRDVARFMAGGADTYSATEYVQRKSAPITAPIGQRSPGAKEIWLLQRREGMSRQAFVDHWLHVHAPLALASRSGISQYVASVVEARLSETGERWDGIAELHYSAGSGEGETGFSSSQARQRFAADLAGFVGRFLVYPVYEWIQK
jgi:EthD domain